MIRLDQIHGLSYFSKPFGSDWKLDFVSVSKTIQNNRRKYDEVRKICNRTTAYNSRLKS